MNIDNTSWGSVEDAERENKSFALQNKDNLFDAFDYDIEVVAGMHEGVKCMAMWNALTGRFEGYSPNDISVPFERVKVLGERGGIL